MSNMLHELDACQKVIIENAIDGIITIDSNGIILTLNTAVSKLFGYSKEELIGQNVSIIMPSPHRAKHDSYINNYLNTGKAKIIGLGREVKGKHKKGNLIPLRLAVSKVEFENKVFFTGILHDLSDIKHAEKKITQLNEELEKKVQSRTEELNDAINKLLEFNHELKKQIHERELIAMALTESEEELKKSLSKEQELNELKSKFISLASHEFRTPLSSILSSANLLERYITPENKDRKERHLDRIKRSVENLNGILEDILSLSKLEEGMINTQFSDFNLEAFFEDLLDEMSAILKPGQEFKTDLTSACVIVHSDVRILHNICVNLLSNAIKYSKENSHITVSLVCDDDVLNISIEDQGLGIPLNEQRHLFTRFYRGSNVTNIKGTGLGLNIVEKYVELLNGTISFESVPGKGSTFKINLPK